MSYPKVYLAVDLGAGSGRVIAGVFDGAKLRLEEITRFDNEAVEILGSIHWDMIGLYNSVRSGLRAAMAKYGPAVISAGIDTWGVDYALIDRHGSLLGLPYAYRDPRTNGMIGEANKLIAPAELYARTGIQSIFFNTLYQLLAEKRERPEALDAAEHLLFTPDLLNYWLTGVVANERSIASTSQLYDPSNGCWAEDIIAKMGLPRRIFGKFVEPGAKLGQAVINDQKLNIVSVCSHDTGSAIAGTPLMGKRCAYISSGTWSLLGIESDHPFLTPAAQAENYTNEVGYGGSVDFLKNMSGLWIVQECKRHWDRKGQSSTFDQLVREADDAPAFAAFIDPDDPAFVAPGRMPDRLAEYLCNSGQAVPETHGAMMRVVFESMALNYRSVIGRLEGVAGRHIEQVHIVGGGCRNTLLNQFTANALNRPVLAGPSEAAATGNILVQMLADEAIDSIEEGRRMVRDSFEIELFPPADKYHWEDAGRHYGDFLSARFNV